MSSPNNTAVMAKDLTKVFGTFTAVDHVSFEVKTGEIFGFLGPNGAGKTTTIKILCGLLTPTSGMGVVAGWDCSNEYEQIRKNIGYMSQKFSIYEELTVEENMDFFGGVYGLIGAEKERRMQWALEMANLTESRSTLTGDLPLGWKQRLALSCAVLHEPPILFLDEPTSGVDPISRRSFWDLIHHMAEEGKTIFVTTHYMDEAGYCNRLALMSAGKIIALGSPRELKSDWMPDSVMELETDDLHRTIEALQGDSSLTEVAVFGNLLHIVASDPDQAMRNVRITLERAEIPVKRMEVVPPTLEDVFVTLTSPKEKRA